MREILFRGKRTDNGEWIYGYYFFENINVFANFNGCHYVHPCGQNQALSVIPETVGQYTGLTDKNGKRIFEGDILQYDYIGNNLGVSGTAVVSFQNGTFGVEWGWHKNFVCVDGFTNTTMEVIGNIYDNAELLGDK